MKSPSVIYGFFIILSIILTAGCGRITGPAAAFPDIAGVAGSVDINEARNTDTRAVVDNVPVVIVEGLVTHPEIYGPQLVSYLTSGYSDPILKIKVLHDWLVKNVYYDFDELNHGGRRLLDPMDILREKHAVCAGQSYLFEYLCSEAGVTAPYIEGEVKGYDGGLTLGRHAWNLVKINDDFYIIDVTWNNANTYEYGSFTDDYYDTGFLFIRPEYAIHSHFPENTAYQCLDDSVCQFEWYECLRSIFSISGIYESYHESDISFSENIADVKSTSVGPVTYDFDSAEDIEYIRMYNIDRYGINPEFYPYHSILIRESGTPILYIRPPDDGYYRTILYEKDENDDYIPLAQLVCRSSDEQVSPKPYPASSVKYYEQDCSLISPLDGELQPGSLYTFSVQCPGAAGARMYFLDGETYTPIVDMNQTGDIFSVDLTVPDTEPNICICVKPTESEDFFTILTYGVAGVVGDGRAVSLNGADMTTSVAADNEMVPPEEPELPPDRRILP